jgi:hypothetical protein
MTEYDLKLYLDNQFRDIKEELRLIQASLTDHVQRISGAESDVRYIKDDVDQMILNKDRDHQRIWDNFSKCKIEEAEKAGIYSKNNTLGLKLWLAGLTIFFLIGLLGFLAKEFLSPLQHPEHKKGEMRR